MTKRLLDKIQDLSFLQIIGGFLVAFGTYIILSGWGLLPNQYNIFIIPLPANTFVAGVIMITLGYLLFKL